MKFVLYRFEKLHWIYLFCPFNVLCSTLVCSPFCRLNIVKLIKMVPLFTEPICMFDFLLIEHCSLISFLCTYGIWTTHTHDVLFIHWWSRISAVDCFLNWASFIQCHKAIYNYNKPRAELQIVFQNPQIHLFLYLPSYKREAANLYIKTVISKCMYFCLKWLIKSVGCQNSWYRFLTVSYSYFVMLWKTDTLKTLCWGSVCIWGSVSVKSYHAWL